MSKTGRRTADADIPGIWRRFKLSRGAVLDEWVEAEKAVAVDRSVGTLRGPSGDKLLAAEAALQGAIIDFAAAEGHVSDPTPIALELLRLAEGELVEDPTPTPNGSSPKG